MSKNVIFLFLVIITTINASRIFYLPLPKIHPSHQELKSSPIAEESIKQSHKEKSIDNEFLPTSAMERHMYEKQESNIFKYLFQSNFKLNRIYNLFLRID